MSHFDDWFDSEDGQVYGGKHLVDLEMAYDLLEDLTIIVGGQNVFDQFPEENPGARAGVGNLYSQFSPFGFNGSFWYTRLKMDFDWNKYRQTWTRPERVTPLGGLGFGRALSSCRASTGRRMSLHSEAK